MRRLAPFAALLLAGCGGGGGQDAMILFPDGGYRAELAGTAAAGFTAPDGLLWHDGALLMADEAGSALRAWRAGSRAATLAGPDNGFTSPEDLVRDGVGNLWFTDDNVGGLRRLAPDGRVTLVAGPDRGLGSTEGIALSPSGDLVVGDGEGHRVFLVSPEGAVRDLIGPEAGIAKPESMAFDDRGNLYIADNEEDVLYLRTAEGALEAPIRGRGDFSPESIIWADGGLFITDSKNGRLWRYSPAAGLVPVAAFAGEFANVQGIAAAPSGALYLSIRAGPEHKRGYILKLVPKRG